MNYDKAQKEVFNALLHGDRVCGYKFDDDHFFVTTDGYRGYIFPNNLIQFNTEKINTIIPLADITEPLPENELKLTLDFKAEDYTKGKMYRRLKADGRDVYVNDKFLACFQNARFFQKKEKPLSLITVTERFNPRGKDIPVGVILPIRITKPDWLED